MIKLKHIRFRGFTVGALAGECKPQYLNLRIMAEMKRYLLSHRVMDLCNCVSLGSCLVDQRLGIRQENGEENKEQINHNLTEWQSRHGLMWSPPVPVPCVILETLFTVPRYT